MAEIKRRPIRSFVLRQGRLTKAQQYALDNFWLRYGIDFSDSPLDLESVFGNAAPVTLEIGFGNGDSLFEQACDFPQRNFIGIEVHRPGVGHLLHRIHQQDITNLRVINHDAVDVLKLQIPENSLDRVQLFSRTPGTKNATTSVVYYKKNFIELIRTHLLTEGHFHMATDWDNYAQHMYAEMQNSPGFVNTAGEARFVAADGLRPQTKFEERGLKLGHGVWDLLYKKIA